MVSSRFNAQDLNVYRYSWNNPLKYTDPMGTSAAIEYACLADYAVGAGTTAGTTAATWIASAYATIAGNLGAQNAPEKAQYIQNSMMVIAGAVAASSGACRAVKKPGACKASSPTKPGGNSFAAGTVVFTSRGLKPIEDVEVGDLVAAWNPETDKHDWKPVTARSSRQADAVFKLTVRAENGREETVVVTPNHPYLLAANDNGPGGVETVVQMVPGGGWTAAGFLKPGDQIRSVANGSLTVVAAELDRSTTRVYTLEVADSHTYAVGDLQAWVHNSRSKPGGPQGYTTKYGGSANSGSGYTIPKNPTPDDAEILAQSIACRIAQNAQHMPDKNNSKKIRQQKTLLKKVLDRLK
jgi:Pretoxin HINT domain